MTSNYNKNNILNVQKQILMRQGYNPYYATSEQAKSTITDFDHFPYTRWFRGEYYNSDPVIIEREAGWRPHNNDCYNVISPPVADENFLCFQYPCSTILPCDKGDRYFLMPDDAHKLNFYR